ncbi:MAG: hypothetical protein J1G02_05355 [Clostridiales bacterium]|nr:hypothetical protein [Clostridiales bacterium]
MNPINEKLLVAQQEWKSKMYDYILKGNKGQISCPFSCGVSDKYLESDKKVMIIGQEAVGLTCEYDTWNLISMQKWNTDYLERQLDICHNEYKWNKSPFWQFIRKLNNAGCFPCWNNLEKVVRYECGKRFNCYEGKGENRKAVYYLYDAEREMLNQKCIDGRTLLQKEIEITQPDVIIFAVGARDPYYNAIELAFGLQEGQLKNFYPKVSKEINRPCSEISAVLGLNVLTYWTYHPRYLRQANILNQVIEIITKK